ncbi:MAG: gliding motility-associated ABC transporter substrate-binding protein GldG [Saprospiraceae bacterium]
MARSRRIQDILQFALFCGIVFFVNILANAFYTHLDLTEEKRFTLTQPTRELLKDLDDRIYVQVLLEGDFPAGFKRLQTATREMLDDFRGVSGYVDYAFSDPNQGSAEEINERRKALAEDGIVPVNLRVAEQGETSQKIIYPVAIFNFGERRIPVKLLENESPSLSPDQVINNSVSLLEYKFANAVKKLRTPTKPIILFTRGHGELEPLQTADLERGLRQFYETDRITLDSVTQLKPDECALLIVAKPRFNFPEKDKFKIDQYIMQGGKVLWLIDRLNAELDSMRFTGQFIPQDYPLNLEDQLFKYGARIQPDLVLDLECTKIPLRVGQLGNAPQFDLFDWFYHPAVLPAGKHPVVKNLDRVELKFCSSIDTIRTKTPVAKTVLLTSSRYSRLQFSPVNLNFEILRYQPDPEKFNKGMQTVGVLLEGVFPSNYENRVSEEMMAGLRQLGMAYRSASVPNRMIVISDGDVAANVIRDPAQESWFPLGFNRFENKTYANRELMLNAVEYLIEANGVIEARSKEVKLRLLDNIKAKEEKTFWQLLNIAVPLLFLGLFGWLFHWLRKRKYAA